MRARLVLVAVILGALAAWIFLRSAPTTQAADKAAPKVGLEKRIPWTTSKVRGSPEPPSPFRTEIAFPKLKKFDEPLDLEKLPGTDRIVVVERYGRIFTLPTKRDIAQADLLLDYNQVLGRTGAKTLAVYGFAAHPQFAKNGYVYVTCAIDLEKELPKGTRVSRFKVTSMDPPSCDPKSEQILIEWPCGGHNGGCLKFGPDGYLYIGTGDSSGIADQYQTGQNLESLAGKILRIDVDKPDAGKPYGIPKDNPFVAAAPNAPDGKVIKARPEVYAYGLRQPWKMSFDFATGDFWVGNVGQDLWEQIYKIEKGGNYGWSILEGSHAFRPERPRGPTPILMPTVEHDHANFRSITGGFIYHGKRLKDLVGQYIYGDYDTGRIWAFRYDRKTGKVSDHRELFKSHLRLVGFGEDAEGELYLCDHMSGRISRLIPNPAVGSPDKFPKKLSETGLFSSVEKHVLAPGIIPYDVIAPQWVDGATKERFLGLPGESQIEFETITYPQPAPGSYPGWRYPDGAVLAETIYLDTDKGRRRIETRILHNENLTGTEEVGNQYWRGYTYIWSDDQTDAVLLEDPQGMDKAFSVKDPKAPDGKRQQGWHFPSRTECTTCHNMAAKYVLGLQTLQANRAHDYGPGGIANQLATFEHIGLFTKPLPKKPDELPRIADYHDAKQGLNLRARSYLHANCSHCHRKWGGGNAEFQLLATLELAETGTNVRPAQGTFNIPNARVVAPHDPFRSIMFYRMSTLGPGRMPRLGSSVVDEDGVELIGRWIATMPGAGLVPDPANHHAENLATSFEKTWARFRSGELTKEEFDKKLDAYLELPGAGIFLAQLLSVERLADREKVKDAVVAYAVKSNTPEIRDLFERFLPEEKRVKRLGAVVRPEQILALPGDVERGKKLFFDAAGVQCKNCHRIGGKGQEVGPDLDQIGKKYDRAQILDNILFPSKQIEEKYLTWVLETKKGVVHQGILVKKDAKKVVLKDATNKLIEVPADDVDTLVSQQKSLMPELLLRDLTAEQVADLTAFLRSLK
jgi:uncharacterized repeat protein (TIGR03806 family)